MWLVSDLLAMLQYIITPVIQRDYGDFSGRTIFPKLSKIGEAIRPEESLSLSLSTSFVKSLKRGTINAGLPPVCRVLCYFCFNQSNSLPPMTATETSSNTRREKCCTKKFPLLFGLYGIKSNISLYGDWPTV